jgi:hypothetical protein
MTKTTKIIGLIGLILLVGGGALFYAQQSPKLNPIKTGLPTGSVIGTPPTKEITAKAIAAINQNEKTPTKTDTSSQANITLPVIDDTWKTYTNKSSEFSFQWPTKGRYAPTWDASYAETDPCTEGETKILNGNTFCHQMSAFRSDDLILTHIYTIPFGKKFIVITFTKKAAQAGFDEATFDAHLDQIMSTFAFKK